MSRLSFTEPQIKTIYCNLLVQKDRINDHMIEAELSKKETSESLIDYFKNEILKVDEVLEVIKNHRGNV